jgi:hypothetical protein
MPAVFIVLGIAVVVFIAAAGHHKPPTHRDAPAGLVVELDRGMPPSVVGQVLTALGEESDPGRLDALGTSLGAYYPLAASELHAKAILLRAGAPAPAPAAAPTATPAALPAALPAHDPAPAPAPATASPPPGPQLDAAAVLQAAMRALVEETDPVVLEGFAESIRPSYPAAADILTARAQTLRASPASVDATRSAGASPAASPAPTASQSPEVSS